MVDGSTDLLVALEAFSSSSFSPFLTNFDLTGPRDLCGMILNLSCSLQEELNVEALFLQHKWILLSVSLAEYSTLGTVVDDAAEMLLSEDAASIIGVG